MRRPPGYDKLERAQRLRREMTPQEQILWSQLRGRRFNGFKFRRQMWLAGYIADFACPDARLVVEADGSQHADNPEYDAARERAFAPSAGERYVSGTTRSPRIRTESSP